jgi:hypothetical protein
VWYFGGGVFTLIFRRLKYDLVIPDHVIRHKQKTETVAEGILQSVKENHALRMNSEWMMFVFVFVFVVFSFACFLPYIFCLFVISLSPFVCFFYNFFNSLLLSMLPLRNRNCWGCSGPAILLSLIQRMAVVWLYDLTSHRFTSITFSDVTHRHTAIISLYWNQKHKREWICFSQLFSLRVRTVWGEGLFGVLKQPITVRNWIDRRQSFMWEEAHVNKTSLM